MKKVLTIILDGFGAREEEYGNAIKAAEMTTFNNFYKNNPHTLLWASEERVGLLKGQMGSSEVGHLTIGAGRILDSNMTKISKFFSKELTSDTFNELLLENNKRVHIMGLTSDGNVHSSIEYMLKMYDELVLNGFKEIYFHVITDGRDTKTDVAMNYINMINNRIKENNIGAISTICGRYYAMDRDSNYDRTKLYYDLITKGIGQRVNNIENALEYSYEKDETDEFIKPMIINDNGLIKDNDIILWMNFRADRAKQILKCFTEKKFHEFPTLEYNNLDIYSFFPIDKNIKTKTFFEDNLVDNPLGIYFSKLGLKQARISESEKFPHVTYFFDGEYEGNIEGCDKYKIDSPDVATYDEKPEMSAVGVTKKVIECLEKDYDFILVNYANPDMVGHTGNLDATIKACMALDICLSKLIEEAQENFYTIFLLADHGNADTMINEDGTECTTHSLAKVPFIVNDSRVKFYADGDLSNVAPSILEYMDIAIPKEMTSESIIEI